MWRNHLREKTSNIYKLFESVVCLICICSNLMISFSDLSKSYKSKQIESVVRQLLADSSSKAITSDFSGGMRSWVQLSCQETQICCCLNRVFLGEIFDKIIFPDQTVDFRLWHVRHAQLWFCLSVNHTILVHPTKHQSFAKTLQLQWTQDLTPRRKGCSPEKKCIISGIARITYPHPRTWMFKSLAFWKK